jgi:hypothetical protein
MKNKTVIRYKSYVNFGQSMFEIMFALVIASMILVGVVSLAAVSVRNAAFSKNKALANKYAQEVGEWLKTERVDMGWGDTSSGFYHQVKLSPVWCMNMDDLSWDNPVSDSSHCESIDSTIFTRYFTFVEKTDALQFNVLVFWDDGNGHHETSTTTVLTNWF